MRYKKKIKKRAFNLAKAKKEEYSIDLGDSTKNKNKERKGKFSKDII